MKSSSDEEEPPPPRRTAVRRVKSSSSDEEEQDNRNLNASDEEPQMTRSGRVVRAPTVVDLNRRVVRKNRAQIPAKVTGTVRKSALPKPPQSKTEQPEKSVQSGYFVTMSGRTVLPHWDPLFVDGTERSIPKVTADQGKRKNADSHPRRRRELSPVREFRPRSRSPVEEPRKMESSRTEMKPRKSSVEPRTRVIENPQNQKPKNDARSNKQFETLSGRQPRRRRNFSSDSS
jgi:hypothetical protein